jgi:DNA-binding PadR family transcriptional regulator
VVYLCGYIGTVTFKCYSLLSKHKIYLVWTALNYKETMPLMQQPLADALDDFSKFYILLILHEAPSHGYGILSKYRRRTGQTLSPGTLYPFLQQLEQLDIVSSRDKPVGKRPRREYSLTTKGRKAVNQLFQRFASITAAAFESNLEVCASCGCKVYEGAHFEEIQGRRLAFCCTHCAASYNSHL